MVSADTMNHRQIGKALICSSARQCVTGMKRIKRNAGRSTAPPRRSRTASPLRPSSSGLQRRLALSANEVIVFADTTYDVGAQTDIDATVRYSLGSADSARHATGALAASHAMAALLACRDVSSPAAR